MEPVKLIIDTDIGCDCDDAGALALANVLANLKKCELLAMTHTTSSINGAGCIDIINRHYGNLDIPIGCLKEDGFMSGKRYDVYASKLVEMFGTKINNQSAEDAVSLLRKTLYREKDNSVFIVAIGQLKNMRNLLLSDPDEVCTLTGRELVSKKVQKLVVMGGHIPKDGEITYLAGKQMNAEFNIYNDVESAQIVCNKWPSKIVFSTYTIGEKIKTCGHLVKQADMTNPVTAAYTICCNGERESWDLTAVWYAVMGETDFWELSKSGRISVDDDGITTFKENKEGNHTYLLPKADPEHIKNIFNSYIN